MKIVEKRVTDLIPYENNPRKNDEAVPYVAESIKNFGFKVPIIVDKNNVIVAGHTRLKAAERLGLDKVPCIVADDLTEEQIKASRLADNKVSEFAEWDTKELGFEIDSILEIDMAAFGFDLGATFKNDELEDTDEAPVSEEVIIKIKFPTLKEWRKQEEALRALVDTFEGVSVSVSNEDI